MSEFCNYCYSELFDEGVMGPGGEPDIDVDKIFKELEEGEYQSCLCEGCSMICVGRHNDKMVFYIGEMHTWVDEDFEPIDWFKFTND